MTKKIILIFFIAIQAGCVQLFAKDIRVVSLAPAITETLFAIGLDQKEIVAVTDYCDYPKAANDIPRAGSLTTINIEKIVSLEPDYVFSTGNVSSPLNTRLKNVGLNVVVLDAENINGVFSNIETAGKVLNREKEARAVINQMRARLEAIEERVKKISVQKKVYAEIWDDPMTSCGKGSFVDEVITKAGGINITGNIGVLYPTVSQEFIIKENPDFIILGYMSRDQEGAVDGIARRFGWRDINVVKTKNIISDIDPNIFLRPGPRIVNGIEEIHNRLYGNK